MKITVQATIDAPAEKVWNSWVKPDHIVQWNFAIPEWHCPKASNDLREGGTFSYRMEAKNGSMGFDFEGTYKVVNEHEKIVYALEDDRTVEILFQKNGDKTEVTETFEIEDENSAEQQKQGWQGILNNFKSFVETH